MTNNGCIVYKYRQRRSLLKIFHNSFASRTQNLRHSMAPTKNDSSSTPVVGVIMGSKSDWPTMEHATEMLASLGIAFEAQVVSAHRTPELLVEYAQSADKRGIKVIIAGAGGAAHLPGMVASLTRLPVLGVPIQSKALNGIDSLLSIAQMPGGVPVGTLAIGNSGAKNAGLLAARILSLEDTEVRAELEKFITQQTESVLKDSKL